MKDINKNKAFCRIAGQHRKKHSEVRWFYSVGKSTKKIRRVRAYMIKSCLICGRIVKPIETIGQFSWSDNYQIDFKTVKVTNLTDHFPYVRLVN